MSEHMRDTSILTDYGVNLDKCLELFGTIDKYNFTLDTFFKTIEKNVVDLKSYKEIADTSNYAILTHSIKSEARYFGFEKLADLAYEHELAAKKNDIYFIYNNFDSLMTELSSVIATIGKYLDREITINISVASNTPKEKSILVVDDSDVIRNFINSIFNDKFEVLTAADGAEALSIIENTDKKIIGMLLDLEMPNVDGFYVLDIFKTRNWFNRIPVCIITGNGIEEIDEYVRKYPIVDILKKPFNEKDVKEKVEKFISNNK